MYIQNLYIIKCPFFFYLLLNYYIYLVRCTHINEKKTIGTRKASSTLTKRLYIKEDDAYAYQTLLNVYLLLTKGLLINK